MKFRQTDEGFDWVLKGESVDEQVSRLKQWAGTNQTLVPLVRIGVGAEKVEWNLPEGQPENIKLKEDIPEGMGETSIQLEWRRISQFFDPASNMNKLPDWKREMNWLQILEGVHANEAKVLTAVKDAVLLSLYPKLEKLMEPLGITGYNKPVKTKKKTPKKKKVSK
jgi:hypothetical protein